MIHIEKRGWKLGFYTTNPQDRRAIARYLGHIPGVKPRGRRATFAAEPRLLELLMRQAPDIELSDEAKEWYENRLQEETQRARLLDREDVDISDAYPYAHKLRPYQRVGANFLAEAGRSILADDCGLGKTVQAIAAVEMTPRPNKILIVCPNPLKLFWKSEIETWSTLGLPVTIVNSLTRESNFTDYREAGRGWLIINYAQVYRTDTLEEGLWDWVILDECFPAGTKIKTPEGEQNIEDLKPGDEIINAVGIGRIKRVRKRTTARLVRLHLSNGVQIEVTPNHPFFTEEGWIPAGRLEGKTILSFYNIYDIMSIDRTLRKDGQDEENRKEVRVVRQNVHNHTLSKTTFLRHLLFSEVEVGSARISRETKKSSESLIAKEIPTDEGCSQKESEIGSGSVGTDEARQSYARPQEYSKDERSLRKVWAPLSKATTQRRQRAPAPTGATYFVCSLGRSLEGGDSYPHRAVPKQVLSRRHQIPNKLQGGFSLTKSESLDRSGWMVTRDGRNKRKGQEKRVCTTKTRVERVEILESRGGGRPSPRIVYNLEVSGHPSFYAEGYLVHNCHRIKNRKTDTFQAVKKFEYRRCALLTGTPMGNDPSELWALLNFLDSKHFSSYWRFYEMFVDYWEDYWGSRDVLGVRNNDLLRKELASRMARRKKAEVSDELPPKTYQTIPLELSDLQKELYSKMASEMLIELENGDTIEAVNAMSKLVRLRQIVATPAVFGFEDRSSKLDQVMALVEKYDKLVVFTEYRATVRALSARLEEAGIKHEAVLGGMGDEAVATAVECFQTDEKCRVFAGTRATGGTGITLTAASVLVFVSKPWSAAQLSQAEDRVDRIGQNNKVLIITLTCPGTVDDFVEQVLDKKLSMTKEVLSEALIEELKPWAK